MTEAIANSDSEGLTLRSAVMLPQRGVRVGAPDVGILCTVTAQDLS